MKLVYRNVAIVKSQSLKNVHSVYSEEDKDRKKKAAHCVHERKRKDKIKIGIQKIGQLLPMSYRGEKEVL